MLNPACDVPGHRAHRYRVCRQNNISSMSKNNLFPRYPPPLTTPGITSASFTRTTQQPTATTPARTMANTFLLTPCLPLLRLPCLSVAIPSRDSHSGLFCTLSGELIPTAPCTIPCTAATHALALPLLPPHSSTYHACCRAISLNFQSFHSYLP